MLHVTSTITITVIAAIQGCTATKLRMGMNLLPAAAPFAVWPFWGNSGGISEPSGIWLRVSTPVRVFSARSRPVWDAIKDGYPKALKDSYRKALQYNSQMARS
jgi:hypothetical protein